MGGKAFKVRLAYSFALNNFGFAQLFLSFVNNVMKCETGLGLKFKCVQC